MGFERTLCLCWMNRLVPACSYSIVIRKLHFAPDYVTIDIVSGEV